MGWPSGEVLGRTDLVQAERLVGQEGEKFELMGDQYCWIALKGEQNIP